MEGFQNVHLTFFMKYKCFSLYNYSSPLGGIINRIISGVKQTRPSATIFHIRHFCCIQERIVIYGPNNFASPGIVWSLSLTWTGNPCWWPGECAWWCCETWQLLGGTGCPHSSLRRRTRCPGRHVSWSAPLHTLTGCRWRASLRRRGCL